MSKSTLLVTAYLAAIVVANLLTATFGPAISIINAFVLISVDLTTRDHLHDAWHGRWLWPRMACLIAAGSAISYLLNAGAGRIALASLVAFGAAGLIDALTYTVLGRRARLVRVNGSNVLSALVDSTVFPAVAFGWPLLWAVMLGQFLAKVGGGFVWSVVLDLLTSGRRAQADVAGSV